MVSPGPGSNPKDPKVTLAEGAIEGSENAGVFRFLGIAYAEPPVRDLRWRAPQPPSAWDGIRPAKQFGPSAVQTVGASFTLGAPSQSEDCLSLNVWTTTLDRAAKQPVMVWFHGGGNIGGGGSEDAFDGTNLARRGVTLVTCNYRLGAFGFIAHPKLGANFAVLDQLAVLEWVARNIAGFGGDPRNVTIFGESAGAIAVRSMLVSPRARGLFHRAILQSAGFERFAFAPAMSMTRATQVAEQLFDRLGTDDADALRRLPTDMVKRASHELCGVIPRPGHVTTPADLAWMPVPDGAILDQEGFSGWPDDVPLMLGCVENEARYFIKPDGVYSPERLKMTADALCGSLSGEVLALLASATDTPYAALDSLLSSLLFFEPMAATAQRVAAMSRKVFLYHFARVSPGARQSGDLARHTSEIRYVFGNLDEDGAYDQTDRAISDLMQYAWVSFARTGVPSGGEWPAYRQPRPLHLRISDDFVIAPFEISPLTALLQSLRAKH